MTAELLQIKGAVENGTYSAAGESGTHSLSLVVA